MADIGMVALSVFLMQSPSFLAHQRALAEGRTRSNAHTLFGLARIPCDNHVRQMLDGVPTAHFDDEFHALAGDLGARGALEPMRRLGGRTLVALDGTEFFRSRRIRCDNCSTRKRADGGTEHFHQMVAAHVVAPGRAQSLPLPPEFVQPQDGAEKQDCERQAVKRWLAPRRALRRPAAGPSRRRPVRLPARLQGHARRRRRLPADLQAAQPPDPLRAPRRHPPAHPPRRDGLRREAPRPPLPLDDRPARPRRRRRPARQLAGDRQRPPRRHRHLPRRLRHQPRRRPRQRRRTRRLAPAPAGRSGARPSTSSSSTATTSSTTSATAGTPSPACSSSSTCSPSACTPPANSPKPSGSRPGSGSAPDTACSSTCAPSPNTRCSPTGTPYCPCSPPAAPPPSRPDTRAARSRRHLGKTDTRTNRERPTKQKPKMRTAVLDRLLVGERAGWVRRGLSTEGTTCGKSDSYVRNGILGSQVR